MNTVSGFRIGADIGGTFTDIVLLGEDGRNHRLKVATDTVAPERGVLKGIRAALEETERDPQDCQLVAHGQTIGVNALIKRSGANVGLLCTKGFGDILEVGRGRLPDPFDFLTQRTPALVRRDMVREIDERITADGSILRELNDAEVCRAGESLIASGAESLVVAFHHSYRNGDHELKAVKALEVAFPDLPVTASSAVWPQAREYERAVVAVVNEYVRQSIRGYINRLQQGLEELGVEAPLFITSSNGGLISAQLANELPVSVIKSGPASGVVAAQALRMDSGTGPIVTFDMGGTSADMAVLVDDLLPYSWEREIAGLPLVVPMVDVATIGAGGGSIASWDSAGTLRVGPDSAGADPGPACYGRGGTRATITDAFLVMGIVDPQRYFESGTVLDLEASRAAIKPLADKLNASIEQAADGILAVANANLMREFLRVAAEKGADPRLFTLLAFGGAGPTQACRLAEDLHMGKIVIPPGPGTFAAWGSLSADFRLDYVRTVYNDLAQVDPTEIDNWYEEIKAEGEQMLSGSSRFLEEFQITKTADIRYRLQGYDIPITFTDPQELDGQFRRRYYELYGHWDDQTPLDLVSLQGTVVGTVKRPSLFELKTDKNNADQGPVAKNTTNRRKVYVRNNWLEVDVYNIADLGEGSPIIGPCIIEQSDTTCLVLDGWHGEVNNFGAIVLGRENY